MAGNPGYGIILSSKAQREITSSWEWYEAREQYLGDEFLADVMQKLNIISKNPETFSIKHKSYREATASVFPFLIIYKINKRQKLIEVVSVFHSSRNPKRKY